MPEQFKVFNKFVFLGVFLATDHTAVILLVLIPDPNLT